MNRYIVTTTIQSPTKATLRFCKMRDWKFVIVGDLKTPHEAYKRLEKKYSNVTYLSPEYQKKRYKQLSEVIGWRSIQRRNVGFVYAYEEGADVVATIDDDNIPYKTWGENLYIGKTISVACYEPRNGIFDPLSVTKANQLWHRGYPIELLQTRKEVRCIGKIKRKVLVQADLWEGDPDVDAIARLTYRPIVNYSDVKGPYCSNKISPFNSQNTFLAREVLPFYAVLPYVGRMDDIWGGYILQKYFPNSVVYNKPTVYQERNKQDLIKNLENEIIGYRNSLQLIKHLSSYVTYLPPETQQFYKIYRSMYK